MDNSNKKSTFCISKKKIFFIFFIFAVLAWVISNSEIIDNRERFKEDVVDVSMFIYINQQAYPDFCLEHGYKLEQYPEKFSLKVSKEIKRLNALFRKAGINESEIEFADWGFSRKEKGREYAKTKFDELKKLYTLEKIAKQNNVNVEDVIWDDSYYNTLSYNEVCKIFDERSDEAVRSNKNAILYYREHLDNIEEESKNRLGVSVTLYVM